MRAELTSGQVDMTRTTDNGNTVELRLTFLSAKANVRAALASVMSGIGAMNLCDDDNSTVELVLAEVLNNVAEHAYREEGGGIIELHLRQAGQGLICRVLDNGAAMPSSTLPAGYPPNPNRPRELQPEGGFGWFLIRRLTSDLAYFRRQDRNILSFQIAVGQAVLSN